MSSHFTKPNPKDSTMVDSHRIGRKGFRAPRRYSFYDHAVYLRDLSRRMLPALSVIQKAQERSVKKFFDNLIDPQSKLEVALLRVGRGWMISGNHRGWRNGPSSSRR